MYSGLRCRIDALRRKLVLELAVIKLYRLAFGFALKWSFALAGKQSVPEPHTSPGKVGAAGIWLNSHMAAAKYLEECQGKNTVTEARKILYKLLPSARSSPYDALLALDAWGANTLIAKMVLKGNVATWVQVSNQPGRESL